MRCLQQHIKNRTFEDYAHPSVRNFLICVAIGFLWLFQYAGVKMSEPFVLREMRYISFGVMLAATIFFSNIAGILLAANFVTFSL